MFLNTELPDHYLEGDELREFLKQCSDIWDNGVIKKIYDALIAKQMLHIARNVKDDIELSFSRGSINGLDLLFNQLNEYHLNYKDIMKKKKGEGEEEEFDKSEIF